MSTSASHNTNRNLVWGGITAFLLLGAIAYTSQTAGAERVKRGEYLVSSAGCHDCHTPLKMGANGPEPDMSRMLSGHPEMVPIATPPELGKGPWLWAGSSTNTAFAGPWGLSFAMNLTPDRNTGLGIWTEDMFVAAIRTGRHMGTSRPINPPMPWPAYRNLNDEDLKSIYAYLRTVTPIVNHVPDYIPPAPSATTTQAEVR
jgi:Cytochrome c